jgi:hypothetical protein
MLEGPGTAEHPVWSIIYTPAVFGKKHRRVAHRGAKKMESRSIIFGAGIALTMALTAPTIAVGMEMSHGAMNHSAMNHSGMSSGMSGKHMMSKKRMKMHRMMMTHNNKMHGSKNM